MTTMFVLSEKIFIHEDYDNRMPGNDISIIKLSRALEITNERRPVCIFMDYVEDSLDFIGFKGEIVTINGQDITATMQSATFNITDSDDCYETGNLDNNNTMCAISSNENGQHANTCKGDSGSPLLFESKMLLDDKIISRWYLLGIVAMGDKDCVTSSSTSTMLTNIPAYRKWINDTIQIDSLRIQSYDDLY